MTQRSHATTLQVTEGLRPREPSAVLRWIAAALVPATLALVLYLPVLEAGFAYDDPMAVTTNPLVTGAAPAGAAFTRGFWGDRTGYEHLASWRPLTVLSLRADHALGDGSPAPFHATNLILHVLLVWASLLLARSLGLGAVAAGALGCTVAVHPAFAEAVASIVGRGDLLAAVLGIGGLALVLARSWPAHAAGLLLLALALLSKETAVAIAFAAMVLCIMQRRFKVAGLVVLLVVAWYIARAAAVGHLGGPVPGADNQLAGADLFGRTVGALAIVGHYLGWWLAPLPIAPDHGPAVVLAGRGGAWAWIGLLATASLVVLAVRTYRARRIAPFAGLALALIALALLSNALFVLPTPLAGRLALVPALGLTLALIAGLVATRAPAALATAALALWLGAGLPGTTLTIAAWRSDASLFALGVELQPRSVRARVNLAVQQLASGQVAAADDQLATALALVPEHPKALLNRALSRKALGDEEGAWEHAGRALARERVPGHAWANYCALGLERSDVDISRLLAVCRGAVAAIPGDAAPAVNLARAMAKAGELEEAERGFRAALARWPASKHAMGHWIGFLAATGRPAEAVELQRKFLAQDPRDPERRRNLVALLFAVAEASGPGSRACAAVHEAEALVPGVEAVTRRAHALCPGG